MTTSIRPLVATSVTLLVLAWAVIAAGRHGLGSNRAAAGPVRERRDVPRRVRTAEPDPIDDAVDVADDGDREEPAHDLDTDTRTATFDLDGVVVDLATREPIAGARVFLFQNECSWGVFERNADARTNTDGHFDASIEQSLAEPVEFHVAAPGYECRRGSFEAGATIELVRSASPALPGRVRGRATTSDGLPLAGEVEVHVGDEFGKDRWQYAFAGTDGSFLLEGVPPGDQEFYVYGGEMVRALVGDEADAFVLLPASPISDSPPAEADATPAVPEGRLARAKRRAVDAAYAWESACTDKYRAISAGEDDATCEKLDRTERECAAEMYGTERAMRALLPRREVIVGISGPERRTWVRARSGTEEWCVEADGGEARFPALPPGEWTFSVVRPGEPDRTLTADVPAGDGAHRVAFD
jgi:hypothetical protein